MFPPINIYLLLLPTVSRVIWAKERPPEIVMKDSQSMKLLEVLRGSSGDFNIASDENITVFMGTYDSGLNEAVEFLFTSKEKMPRKFKAAPRLILVRKDGQNILFYQYLPFDKSDGVTSFSSEEMLYHNMLLKLAKNVRYILMAPYNTHKPHFEYNLQVLIRHAHNVIPNITRIQNNIGVIFTNVDYTNPHRPDMVIHRSEFIKSIREWVYFWWMDLKKGTWTTNGYSSPEKFKETLRFLNMIMNKDDGTDGKITTMGLFEQRRMIREGFDIRKFISKIQYSDTQMKKIDKEVNSVVTSLAEEINNAVQSSIETIGNEMVKETNIDVNTMDLDADVSEFKKTREIFMKLKGEKVDNIRDLIIKVVNIAKQMNMKNVGNIIRKLLDNKDVMDDLESFTGTTLVQPSQWLDGFDVFVSHLHHLEKLGAFMKSIHTSLPGYITEFNVNVDDLITNTLSIFKEPHKTKMKIQEIGFDKIFEVTKGKLVKRQARESSNSFEKAYNNVKDMEIDKANAKALTKALFKSDFKTKILCPKKNKMEIIAQVINATEIHQHILKPCVSKLKHVEVFAFRKFIVNTDLIYKGNETTLAIIAKEWEIRGNRNIVLDGADGEDYKSDPEHPKANGTHGLPGKPGGPGGHFFGFAERVTGNGVLRVSVRGGRGGRGEDGGKGADGENGKLPKSLNFDKFSDRAYIWNRTDHFFGDEDGSTFYTVNHNCHVFWTNDYWILRGTNGEVGKDGGNGGAGGLGGKEGSATFIEMQGSGKIIVEETKGGMGEEGAKGSGGKGGMRGDDMQIKCGPNPFFYECRNVANLTNWMKELERAEPGKDGVPGNNTEGQDQPREPVVYKPYTTVNRFKAVLRESLSDSINKVELLKFLDSMEKTPDVIQLYNYTALIEELKSMEEHFHLLHKTVDFLPFYESLLRRIEGYSKGQTNKDVKLALTSLYAATFSKLCSVKNNVTRFMIVDVEYFLSKLVEDIKVLEKIGKELMVSSYEEEYSKEIDQQIKSANNIIENKFIPEVDKLIAKIKKQIADSYKEYESMQKKAQVDNEEKELRKKFKDGATLNKAMNLIKEVGEKVKTINKIYQHVKSGHKNVKLFMESPKEYTKQIVQSVRENTPGVLGKLINEGYKLAKDLLLDRTECFNKKLKELKNITSLHPVKNVMNEAADKLKKDYKGTITLEEINNYQNKIEGAINEVKKVTQNKYTMEALEFGLLVFSDKDSCEEIKKTSGSRQATALALKDVKSAKNAEDAVKNLGGMVNIQLKQIKTSITDMGNKTAAELTFSTWQLREIFEDVQVQIGTLLSGMKAAKEIDFTFKSLLDLVDSLADVHEKIGNYKDQKKLGQLIGNIASSRNVWDVSDKALYNALNDLTFTIKASGLLVQFDRALDALKQYVFPFAHHFLEEFSSLPDIDLGKEFKDILYTVIPQIEKLYSSLDGWTRSINHHDKYIYNNIDFTEDYYEPFYTFQYSEFNSTINDLLKGKEVLFFPDVRLGIDKEAVKFNKIKISFKLSNGNRQAEFNDLLKNYDIEMTHYGNNVYRCGRRYFEIRSEKQLIAYSFEENIEGNPLRTNLVYDKIARSGYFLSPYAFWMIKLSNVRGSINYLERFVDEPIDLLLEGRGQYIQMNDKLNAICNGKLEQYYTEFDRNADLNDILHRVL